MGVVYRQPSNYDKGRGYNYNFNRSQSPKKIPVRKIIMGMLGFVGVCVGIAAVVFLVLTLYTAIVYLTWPAILRAIAAQPNFPARLAPCSLSRGVSLDLSLD